jgi:hypothetical protein
MGISSKDIIEASEEASTDARIHSLESRVRSLELALGAIQCAVYRPRDAEGTYEVKGA